jgi:cytochrome c biogenesis protein CcdA
MRKLGVLVIFLLLICGHISVAAESPSPSTSDNGYQGFDSYKIEKQVDGKPAVYFFYNQNCGDCLKTLPYLQEFEKTHPDIVFRYYDIRENNSYRQLLAVFSQEYGMDFSPVPVVFTGNVALTGYDEITGGLEDAIYASYVVTPEPTGNVSQSSRSGGGSGLTIPLVISAALVDGINPCAFSVLVFLLLTIMALDTRRKMVCIGSIFILAVFIFYFLSGLGLFTFIQSAGISRAMSLIASVVALLAGTLSIIDGVRAKPSQLLSIPESKKGIIERYIRKVSLPGAFVLGILVGMFELPCTGGIYLAILSLLSNRMSIVDGIPYLLVYNLFFVLPMIVILAVVAFGMPVERLDQLRTEKRTIIRILMGVVMILLGILLLLEFI